MEEAILEILRKGNDVHEFTSEIAEMMTAFIEFYDHCLRKRYVLKDGMVTEEDLPINDIFTLWFTEIYKKQKQ